MSVEVVYKPMRDNMGGGQDLSEYFNKATDDTDDIIQGTSHLFSQGLHQQHVVVTTEYQTGGSTDWVSVTGLNRWVYVSKACTLKVYLRARVKVSAHTGYLRVIINGTSGSQTTTTNTSYEWQTGAVLNVNIPSAGWYEITFTHAQSYGYGERHYFNDAMIYTQENA